MTMIFLYQRCQIFQVWQSQQPVNQAHSNLQEEGHLNNSAAEDQFKE